jgi:MFS family permease
MSHHVLGKAFYTIIAGVFFFTTVLQINFFIFYELAKEKGISSDEIDFIEIMEILSYIVSGYILTQIINRYSKIKLIITALSIYLICTINFIVVENYKLLLIQLVLMSVAKFIFFVSSFLIFTKYLNNTDKAVSWFFMVYSLGCLAGEVSTHFVKVLNLSNIELFLCLILGIVIICIILLVKFEKKIEDRLPNFTQLVKMAELEMLIGFIATYISFSMYWDHEVFALNKGINITSTYLARLYMIIGMLLSIYPIKTILNRFNKFKLNLFFLIILLISFILFQNAGTQFTPNFFADILIGGSLYTLFAINLSILADKFENNEFNYSIAIFATISIIGGYIGIIVTDSLIETYSTDGFLISIYSILTTFLVYYILQFFILRLYKS